MMVNVIPVNPAQPVRPRDLSHQQLALVKRTVAKDCTNDEFELFIEVCRRAGFDPFRRQIYVLVFNKDKADKRQMSIIVGIDGYRATAARNGDYRPDQRAPRIEYDETQKDPDCNPLGIVRAEVSAFQRKDGEWHEIVGEAYWDEFAPITDEVDWKDTGEVWEDSGRPKKSPVPTGRRVLAKDNWKKMARVMIAKCAEAQALRKGWPEDLSGLYAEEEMDRAVADDLSASQAVELAEQERRLEAIGSRDSITFIWRAGQPLEQVALGQIADKILAFAKASDSATEIEHWMGMNRNSLQEFWARQKGDALEVKKVLEKRIADLKRPAPGHEGANTILGAG